MKSAVWYNATNGIPVVNETSSQLAKAMNESAIETKRRQTALQLCRSPVVTLTTNNMLSHPPRFQKVFKSHLGTEWLAARLKKELSAPSVSRDMGKRGGSTALPPTVALAPCPPCPCAAHLAHWATLQVGGMGEQCNGEIVKMMGKTDRK